MDLRNLASSAISPGDRGLLDSSLGNSLSSLGQYEIRARLVPNERPLTFDFLVDVIVPFEIAGSTRQDVNMNMRHRLTGMDSILHGDVESICIVSVLESFADAMNGSVEVNDFIRSELLEARCDSLGDDQHMAGYDGLQVDNAVAESTLEEDLGRSDDPRTEGDLHRPGHLAIQTGMDM